MQVSFFLYKGSYYFVQNIYIQTIVFLHHNGSCWFFINIFSRAPAVSIVHKPCTPTQNIVFYVRTPIPPRMIFGLGQGLLIDRQVLVGVGPGTMYIGVLHDKEYLPSRGASYILYTAIILLCSTCYYLCDSPSTIVFSHTTHVYDRMNRRTAHGFTTRTTQLFIIIKIKIHSSCEIEYFVETHLCKLCVIIRSRVLRVVCPQQGYRSATPLATTVQLPGSTG